jgi:hypothetical protein
MQLKQNEITMNQFTEHQLQGIISPDKERLIYEIGAKTEGRHTSMVSYWPDYSIFFISDGTKDLSIYNSIRKRIAKFKLKSWK